MLEAKLRILIAALMVALCSSPLLAQPPSEAEKNAAVQAHNDHRQRVARDETVRLGGTVTIPNLTWDANLATVAQQFAEALVNQPACAMPPLRQQRLQSPYTLQSVHWRDGRKSLPGVGIPWPARPVARRSDEGLGRRGGAVL
jgi:hypothetical protein